MASLGELINSEIRAVLCDPYRSPPRREPIPHVVLRPHTPRGRDERGILLDWAGRIRCGMCKIDVPGGNKLYGWSGFIADATRAC